MRCCTLGQYSSTSWLPMTNTARFPRATNSASAVNHVGCSAMMTSILNRLIHSSAPSPRRHLGDAVEIEDVAVEDELDRTLGRPLDVDQEAREVVVEEKLAPLVGHPQRSA